MRLLVDAHCLIWAVDEPSKLTLVESAWLRVEVKRERNESILARGRNHRRGWQ